MGGRSYPVAAFACGGLATGYCLAGFQPAIPYTAFSLKRLTRGSACDPAPGPNPVTRGFDPYVETGLSACNARYAMPMSEDQGPGGQHEQGQHDHALLGDGGMSACGTGVRDGRMGRLARATGHRGYLRALLREVGKQSGKSPFGVVICR